MSKFLLLTAIACSTVLFSCKKDDNTSTPAIPKDSTPVIDPIALSAKIKVGYGATSIKGDLPAASTDSAAPVLDTKYDNRTYNAVNNRYIIIYPNLKSGHVTGYYLKINGADSHYKIDYSTAYNLRKAHPKKTNLRDSDNADSTIVIKLPSGLIGDTFSIKYAAYDSLNRISNTLTAIVSITASSDATDDNAVLGKWKELRNKHNDNNWYYNADSSIKPYYCQDGHLYNGTNDGYTNIAEGIYTDTITLNFTANNAVAFSDIYTEYYLDEQASSCSNLSYYQDYYTEDADNGGYSYNAKTKTLTVIYDENGAGSNITTETFIVTELTSGKLSMYKINSDNENHHDALDVYYYEYVKLP